MAQFDDVTKMTLYLILLRFYYIIINLKDKNLDKSRNFGSSRRKKIKTVQYFYKNIFFTS